MTLNKTACADIYGNTGLQKFCGRKGQISIPVLVPKGTEISTKVLALTLATWKDSFNAEPSSRWFPLPLVVNNDATQDEPVFQEFDSGITEFVRDGNKLAVYTFEQMSVYNKNQINKNNGKDWDLFLITDEENILAWSDDGVRILPYSCDYVRITPETDDLGNENGHLGLSVKFSDVNQFNQFQVVLQPTKDSDAPVVFYPSLEFEGIKDLIATVTSPTATGCTLKLEGFDSVPYSGAVSDDIYLALASDPDTLIPITSITETAVIGTYTVVWATQTANDYLIGLKNQPLATNQDFETPVKTAFTIA